MKDFGYVSGEKLERWEIIFWCVRTLRSSGKRPTTIRLGKKNGHYHRSAKGRRRMGIFQPAG